MKKLTTGHVHRLMAYVLIALGGVFAVQLVLAAYMEEAAVDEQTVHLEANVLRATQVSE